LIKVTLQQDSNFQYFYEMNTESDIRGGFLPASKKEVEELGWDQPDVIIFSGDAYVDHPSFGPAVIGRVIENEGFRVAIVPQPNWRDDLRDFRKLGKPKYFFGVTAGNMDSMVNHYTAARRIRSDDAYTPGEWQDSVPITRLLFTLRYLSSCSQMFR